MISFKQPLQCYEDDEEDHAENKQDDDSRVGPRVLASSPYKSKDNAYTTPNEEHEAKVIDFFEFEDD